MADAVAVFIGFCLQLLLLPVPGLGIPFITLASGLMVLNLLFWLLCCILDGGAAH